MNLNTAEKFLVLAHHPEKYGFLIPSQNRNAGFVGAVMLDLALEEKIDLVDGRITVKSTKTNLSQAHREILGKIAGSEKNKKIRTWIARITRSSGKYQELVFQDLETRAIMGAEHKHFLFIPFTRTRMINRKVRNQIISELREVIFEGKKPDHKATTLLGLVEACKMYRTVCKESKEVRTCKKRVREISRQDAIAQGVDRVIRETRAAIIGAVAGATAATVAASGK